MKGKKNEENSPASTKIKSTHAQTMKFGETKYVLFSVLPASVCAIIRRWIKGNSRKNLYISIYEYLRSAVHVSERHKSTLYTCIHAHMHTRARTCSQAHMFSMNDLCFASYTMTQTNLRDENIQSQSRLLGHVQLLVHVLLEKIRQQIWHHLLTPHPASTVLHFRSSFCAWDQKIKIVTSTSSITEIRDHAQPPPKKHTNLLWFSVNAHLSAKNGPVLDRWAIPQQKVYQSASTKWCHFRQMKQIYFNIRRRMDDSSTKQPSSTNEPFLGHTDHSWT